MRDRPPRSGEWYTYVWHEKDYDAFVVLLPDLSQIYFDNGRVSLLSVYGSYYVSTLDSKLWWERLS